jgi:hypothetical protein
MEAMRSMFGSSSAMCIEQTQVEPSRYRAVERKVRFREPRPGDGIPAGMWRCGFAHNAAVDCMDVLPERIAELEFGKREPRRANNVKVSLA